MIINVRRTALVLSAICFVSVACSTIVDVEAPVEPNDAGSDANIPDSSALPDSSAPSDAGNPVDASDAGVETYSALTDPSAWEFFNAAPFTSNFSGAAFDGRFVYFPSQATGKILRYDTTQLFTAPAAWSAFNTLALTGLTNEIFEGATFDGTYVYFVPIRAVTTDGGNSFLSGEVVRFDTRNPDAFEGDAGTGAWSIFDTTTLASDNGDPVGGFVGATFDGHYIYFMPGGTNVPDGGVLRDGLVARFDPTADASLDNAAQWTVFDTATVNDAAIGFYGGVFDGRYLYPVPCKSPSSGLAIRYDVTAPFEDAGAWSTFNLAVNVNASANTFVSGAFDGRYVYFAPNGTTLATRFDTQSNFASAAAWSTHDLLNVIQAALPGASGGALLADTAFDGRYIYFTSNNASVPIVVRYDTQAAFDDAAGWSSINVKTANLDSTLNSSIKDFGSAVFDGQYLYLAGANDGIIARFKAKSPPAKLNLPVYYGSTF